MSVMYEKRLYAPEAKNPGDDIAERLDAANKATNLSEISYKTAFPDFSRAVALTKNTIYHVNAPGWLFRAPNSVLGSNGTNGIIIQGESHMIDVYSIPFKEMWTEGPLRDPKDEAIEYAAPNAKAVDKKKTADVSDSYGVLILPKKFTSSFTQSNRLVYVTYSRNSTSSGGSACQMTPVLPSNPSDENEHYETAITYVAKTDKGDSVEDGVNTGTLLAETRGMYIMHCAETSVNDALIFVPAKCSKSFTNYVTQVRASLSSCNLNMYKCDTIGVIKRYVITRGGTTGENSSCGTGEGVPGVYANLTVYVPNSDHRTVHYALPTDNGNGVNGVVYGHGHEDSFCGCWQDIFMGGTSPDIEGTAYSFKAYQFGSLDTIPIQGKTENELKSGKFPDSAKPKWEDIDFKDLFELNNTTSLNSFSVS